LAGSISTHDGNMRHTLVIAALLALSAALPQQRAISTGPKNTNVKILTFESYQDGANFGHQLFQEDGTTSGQKYAPDGLLYGFYSYVNPDNQRVKVYWRAGEGIGYEVIGVEGLIEENLGNLRATIRQNVPEPPVQTPAPAPRRSRPVVQQQNAFIPTAIPTTPPPPPPTPAPVQVRQPARLHPNQFVPTVPETTPAPQSRFDYPAELNLERTANGFFSSLTATR